MPCGSTIRHAGNEDANSDIAGARHTWFACMLRAAVLELPILHRRLTFRMDRVLSHPLGVVFKAEKTSALYGGSQLLAYGIGHCAVIMVAGISTELVQRFRNWNEQSRG